MAKKWKILGRELEWFDIKTKFKQLLRKITYSRFVQEIICLILSTYMRLVYVSSKKIFINCEVAQPLIAANKPGLLCFWHNRLMMIPFAARKIKKISARNDSTFRFMTLASKHGDGKFVGRTMEKFDFISILGSTRDGRKSSRGIDIGSLKKIFGGFKKGYFLGITPDGPRGPNQKINGEIISIARLSGSALIPLSYSCSRFIKLKSWDQFKVPLPFSTLCFYCDDKVIFVPKESDEAEMEKIKSSFEQRMNFVQEKSLELVMKQ